MFLSVLQAGGARLLYYPAFCKPEVELELMRNNVAELFDNSNYERCVEESDLVYDTTGFLGKVIVQRQVPVKGIIEHTASGISVYKDFATRNVLRQPVLDLDSSYAKRVGENKLATGLGLIEALLRLHLFLPNKQMLVLGMGNVGSSCARYLRGIGCKVAVFDVDSDKMTQAEKLGYQIGALDELLPLADIIVNATASSDPVLKATELEKLKSGTILANMGGNGWDRTVFNDKKMQVVGDCIRKIFLKDSLYVYELAQGFPINFALASGTDAETMDVVFSLSVLALEYLVNNYDSLPKTLQPIPEEIQNRHLELVERYSRRKDLVELKKDASIN